MSSREDHLTRFYRLIAKLKAKHGGVRHLASCNGRDPWPERGVYFFYETGEARLGYRDVY